MSLDKSRNKNILTSKTDETNQSLLSIDGSVTIAKSISEKKDRITINADQNPNPKDAVTLVIT